MAPAMPLMILANASGSRRQQKKRYDEQVEDYRRSAAISIEEAAVDSLVGERGTRRRNFPDPATVLLFATGPRARLWERRPWDSDFLHLRIGTDGPALRGDHQGPRPGRARGAAALDRPRRAGDHPDARGRRRRRRRDVRSSAASVAMWAVAQVAAMHSPSDTMSPCCSAAEPSRDWDWVKWLPHARNDEGHPRPVRLATDEDTRASVIAELLGELRGAPGAQGEGARRAAAPGRRPRRRPRDPDGPGMVSLLKEGPRLRHLLPLPRPDRARAARGVPHRRVVRGRASSTSRPPSSATSTRVRPDLVEPLWLDRLARALAPIQRRLDRGPLLRPARGEPAARRARPGRARRRAGDRGAGSGKGRTTKAVIGESTDGLFAIDIRADGPHGLVAGTTGSGKSELLQTMIASLAVGNRPDEFNFVLVDYKGGAAFKDCNHLPHTVGMVTDLDGHLTTRALESLGAELRRREHQLADADAKDIEDYLAGRQPGDEPMPRLLIVIDEFAALAAELPDFVTGLVDVARRGRSLGVHLILATQRPAGVVSAEIKSNTNLRIALRVTDAGDSDDVIESRRPPRSPKVVPRPRLRPAGPLLADPVPELAGRWSARAAVAAARSGSRTSTGTTCPLLGRSPVPAGEEDDDVSIPTDLASLVAAITDASDELGLPPMRKPWLPAAAGAARRRPRWRSTAQRRRSSRRDHRRVPPCRSASPTSPASSCRSSSRWDLVAGLAPDDRRPVPLGPQQLPARRWPAGSRGCARRPTCTCTASTAATTRCCRWWRCPTSARS